MQAALNFTIKPFVELTFGSSINEFRDNLDILLPT